MLVSLNYGCLNGRPGHKGIGGTEMPWLTASEAQSANTVSSRHIHLYMYIY